MCGIVGFINRNNNINIDSINTINNLTNHLTHRGPDYKDTYIDKHNSIFFGHSRLSILDLSANGNQPMKSNKGRYVILYNGEIYNHLELRGDLEKKGYVFKTKSDTETVLLAFEEYGPQCVERFNGIFAFAIWDTKKKSLFLARDPLGVKPLYLSSIEGGLAFASEAKALLGLLPNGAHPNWATLYQFFSYGYVPSPESPFEKISNHL